MNKKVLKTMIGLVFVFLLAFYVVKIFFPEQFVMAITNTAFINLGNAIDNNIWLTLFVSGITTFITMFLFLSAVQKRWCLKWQELVTLIVIVIGSRFLILYDPDLCIGVTTISMFVLPLIFKGDCKVACFVYPVHYLSQLISLKIRNLPMYLTAINSVISIALTFESYLWLILFYLYFNFKKGE